MRKPRTAIVALSLAVFAGACGSGAGSNAGGSSTDASTDSSAPVPSSSGASSMEGGDEPSDAGSAGIVPSGGSCPTRGDAASCPAPPSGFGFPSSPGGPTPTGYWVGCESTLCSSQTSCTTCICEDGDGGGVWECTSNHGFQESDGAPTPYCALNTGPLDAAAGAVGLVVRCTTDYPTCLPPSPGQSAGWQCCSVSSVGGVREINCMASDAGGILL
jgi:hypothetical protein